MQQSRTADELKALSPDEAMALFDASAPAESTQMIGRWRGRAVRTGHPMDGMLEAAYWYGKEFWDPDTVFPLIHKVPIWGELKINPALLPVGLVTAMPFRDRVLPVVFPVFAPILRTGKPRARLRTVAFRGRSHAAMIYDGQPIIDYFACLGDDVMLGWMQRRGCQQPFFFTLSRETAAPLG